MLVDKIQLVANKCEQPFNPELENEIYGLNLGEPIYISGEHGDNIHDLFGVINDSVSQDYKDYRLNLKKKRKAKYKELAKVVKRDLVK